MSVDNNMDDLKVMLGEIRGEMKARFDSQDLRLNSIEEQTKRTNGRVTALETKNAAQYAAKEASREARVQVQVQHDEERGRVQWWVGTLIAMAGAAGGVIATIAALH
jgi:hypothetical protein